MLTNRKWLRVAIVQTLVVMLCAQMAWAQGQQRGQQRQRGNQNRQRGQGFGGLLGGMFGRGGVTAGQVLSTLRRTEDKGLIALLKLTDSQKKRLEDLSNTRRESMRDRFANFREQSEEERAKATESFRKDGEKYEKDQMAILTSKQKDALHAIVWQLQGARSLLDAKLQAVLKLDKEQVGQIEKLLNPPRETPDRDGFREQFAKLRELPEEERRAAFDKFRKDREEQQKKAEKTRKDNEEKAVALLGKWDKELEYLEATSTPSLTDEQKRSLSSRRGGRQGGTRNRGGQGGNTRGRGNTNRGGGRSNRPSRPE